jgi:autotransporter-associated beta strand protein
MLIVSAISQGSGTAVFNFNGGTLQAGALFSTAMPFALASSGGNATIDTAGYAVTLAGPLSGPGGLVKVDSGTLTLTGSNSYTGGTTISGGTLQIDAGGATGSIPDGSIVNNGTLAFNRSDNYSVASPISGSGNVTQIGPGTLTFAAANNYSGTTLVSGGTLALANSGALQQSTLDTSGAGSVSFGSLTAATLGGLTGSGALVLTNSASAPVALSVGNNGVSTSYSGALSGSGSLAKVGTGTLALTGSNSYTGGTSVLRGLLAVQEQSAIPSGSLLSISANGSVVLGTPGAAEPLGLGYPPPGAGGGSAGPLASQSLGTGYPAERGEGQMAPTLGGGINAVPEPGTMALLAAAAACSLAAAWQRRRRG